MPTIAVIGASENRSKFGNKCVRAYTQAGYEVFPVNPGSAEIEGLPAFRSILDIEAELDVVSVYLPPPVTLKVLEEIARKGAGEILYFNPGSADPSVDSRAEELGLPARNACSIVAIGLSPGDFP